MDIDACAATNTVAWNSKADVVCAARPDAEVFRTACGNSRIGTDVVAAKLGYFLRTGHVESTYAFRAATTSEDAAFDAIYVDGSFGPQRLAFEEGVDAVRTAVYGTLDLPGALGDTTYGPYRIVRDAYEASRTPIVLPHNSAAVYAATGTLEENRLCEEAALWVDRAALATATRGNDAAASTEWAELLAREFPTNGSEHDLIEVVLRDGRTPMSDVRAVRIAESDFDAINEEYLRCLTKSGTTLLTSEEAILVQLAQANDDGTLRLEVVR